MRVLHLPANVASYASHTVRGLRQAGVDARGFVIGGATVQSSEGLKMIGLRPNGKVRALLWDAKLRLSYVRSVTWSDIVHWYFGTPVLPRGFDLDYVHALDKPRIVEWLGSDIRIPEIEFQDNPYYEAAFRDGYEYREESLERSKTTQKRFADAGFACLVPACMKRYVMREYWSDVYVVPQRLVISDFDPAFPDPSVDKPLIVHSASAPIAKGTPAVVKAVEKLRSRFNFDFRLIQNMPRGQALLLMQRADVFLDQFVLGDHGMGALEAMAYGKPVISYIKPSSINDYPRELPIVNANQDNLAEAIEVLLGNGNLRHELGKHGRTYVEKYHDSIKLARRLVDIYHEVIGSRKHRSDVNGLVQLLCRYAWGSIQRRLP